MLTTDMPFLAEFRISENISETKEGYLLCQGVPIARTGTQIYLGSELGLLEKFNDQVTVYRLPEDVFEETALRSIEGKAVTDDHPQEPVTISNHSMFGKGHAQNVRQDGNFVVVDLVITDPVLIQKVKAGKRQVSCGYECGYEPHKDGFKQVGIRINHIAVVDRGRAGPKVRIKDSISEKKGAPKIMNKKQAMAKMLAAFAKDASPEELEQVMAFVNDAEPAPVKEDKPSDAGLLKKFLSLMAKDEESKEEKESKDEEEKKEANDAAILAIINDLKPVMATLPRKQRQAVKDALSKRVKKSDSGNAYAAIKKAAVAHSKKTHDSAPQDLAAIGKNIAASRNPHYQKQA